jgi:hypothetical protein
MDEAGVARDRALFRPRAGTSVDEEEFMAKNRKRQEGEPSSFDPPAGDIGNNGSPEFSDRVAARAYELYLERGGGDGRAWDDWLAAERELAASAPPGEPRK